MRLHNSTDMSASTFQSENKFMIRYQQSHSISIQKKTKLRYSHNQSLPIRSFLLSQTDVHRQEKPAETKHIQKSKENLLTQRSKRKLIASPKNLGSVMDLVNMLSPQTERQSKRAQEQKQYPRIPIQYNDQKINGLPADNMKYKIIYRGYAPKNTYYFLKSLAFNSLQLNPSLRRGQFQLHFQSKFQSGNLSAVARKNPKEFYIFMRQDTNTFGLRQWFYFSVCNKKAGKFKFRVYKYSKYYSLYKQGMKPFVRILGKNQQWQQAGENVKYEYDTDNKSHFLQFQYDFINDNMTVQFATQPPYTYGMLKDYLKLIMEKYPNIRVGKAGQTLSGLDIPKIQIINKQYKNTKRKVIIVIARTHPAQTASNWALQSMIQRIYQLSQLRNYFDFYILPMVNPDGVFLGNHRTGVLGQDLNRNFNGNDLQFFPQVQAIQKIIEDVQRSRDKQIQFLLDLHGHSARRNIFAYGDNHPIQSPEFLMTHILPKLLSQQISTFKYNYCVFKVTKGKKNTARVYLSKKYKINAITFEQSYGLIDEGVIGVQHWRNFGRALADSLKKFHELIKQLSYSGLGKYLSSQIEYQRNLLDQKAKKKAKIFQQLKTQSNAKIKQDKLIHKFKTQINQIQEEVDSQNKDQESNKCRQVSQKSNDESVNSSQLSSGDEELQNDQQGLDYLKKQIIKFGCLKQGTRRQRYAVAERNIQIKGSFQPRLHEQRSSMVPRILKFQMRKRQQAAAQKQKQSGKKRLNIAQKTTKESFQLPQLRKQK